MCQLIQEKECIQCDALYAYTGNEPFCSYTCERTFNEAEWKDCRVAIPSYTSEQQYARSLALLNEEDTMEIQYWVSQRGAVSTFCWNEIPF